MAPHNNAMLLVLLATVAGLAGGQECSQATFGSDSFACACSGAQCDFPGDISPPADPATFTLVSSGRDGGRMAVTTLGKEGSALADTTLIQVDPSNQLQTMLGFGGAFTDAAGINIVSLSAETQDTLIRSYFAPEGIRYDLCRIPIAGTDFSTRPYSYDDVDGDVNLEFFALAEEDYLYKLPLLKRALEVSGDERPLRLFGSPWSPPAWMKENGNFNGQGGLLRDMWGPYSNYFVRFIQAYEAEGVPIWGITTQNEPLTGFQENFPWNTCAWSAEDMRDWIIADLGPTLGAAGYGDVQMMVLDHNRDSLPDYPATILDNPEASQYVDGIAVHWYADNSFYPQVLSDTHDRFPDKFILYTESCEGREMSGDQMLLGSWQHAQNYVVNIIDDLTHYSTGWIDWNIALDRNGGPNWANNFVDSPIIVDAATDTFYKNPMFYAMGHFSKFVVPGARAVNRVVLGDEGNVRVATFVNPDGVGVAIVLNAADEERRVTIEPRTGAGQYLNFVAPARSLHTVLYAVPASA